MKRNVILPIRVKYSLFFVNFNEPIFLEFQQDRMYKYVSKTNSNLFLRSTRSNSDNIFTFSSPILSDDYSERKTVYFDQLEPSIEGFYTWDEPENKIDTRIASFFSKKNH